MTALDRLEALEKEATPGPWWFDGRDVFHKKPGTNLDQVITPLGHLISDTFTADGAINVADVKLWVALRNAAPALIAVARAAERVNLEHGHWVTGRKHIGDDFWLAVEDHLFPALARLNSEAPGDAA